MLCWAGRPRVKRTKSGEMEIEVVVELVEVDVGMAGGVEVEDAVSLSLLLTVGCPAHLSFSFPFLSFENSNRFCIMLTSVRSATVLFLKGKIRGSKSASIRGPSRSANCFCSSAEGCAYLQL